MKKISLLLLVIVSFLSIDLNGQEKILNHKFGQTASDFRIVKWDLQQNEISNYNLIEKVDSQNRVIELKFLEDGKNDFDHLCYLPTWIKYEYPNDSTIIQTNLNSDGVPEANIECELPSKVIYHLSSNKKKIVKTESEYKFDQTSYLKNGWKEKELIELVKELKANEKNADIIDFYSKSLSKLNGIFPISSEFDIEHFYFSELEKEKVIIGIK